MKAKIIGILVCTLLIATALPAMGLTNSKEIGIKNNSSLSKSNRQSTQIEEPLNWGNRGALFMQLPANPNEQWNAFRSDQDEDWRHFDDFWEITSPICDVHWWGFSLMHNGTHWVDCDGANDMVYEITFYHDDGTGKPGDIACNYIDIIPTAVPTGMYYRLSGITGWLQLYYFEADLDPCCQLSDGWVSVFKTYNPSDCIFAWMVCPDANWNMWARNLSSGEWVWSNWDLSFILTDDGDPDIPVLECRGELEWAEVPPGDLVSGSFEVRNNGDPDSILHWKIESYPDWGTNWTFDPTASFSTPDMDWITVDVELNAPEEENEEFEGEIVLINAADPDETCTIPVTLVTPCESPFLQLLEIISQRFPILGQILYLFL